MRKPSKCKIPKISLIGKLMGKLMRKPLGNSGIHTPGAFSKGLPHEENLEMDQKQIPAGLAKGIPKMTTAGSQKKTLECFPMDPNCFPD
jgi:hypothetical protein